MNRFFHWLLDQQHHEPRTATLRVSRADQDATAWLNEHPDFGAPRS